jgi:hypothetical protein
MTLSPDTILKLAKMIPRLSSDHDGEIVATAHAIQRTLQSSGRDWHDLAAAMFPLTVQSDASSDWRSQHDERPTVSWRYHRRHALSQRDRKFIENVAEWRKPLSPLQGKWLRDICKKLEREVAA